MTRARQRLVLTWAKYRRRFGGGEQTRSTPSWFLGEIPARLIVDLGSPDEPGEVDLTAERDDARQLARRNTFTGKTYNSLENISQFFGARGLPFNPPRTAPPSVPAPPGPLAAAPPLAPAGVRKNRTGMTVEHPKYGHGTVVKREGDGEDAKITVNFARFGLKKLAEKYAGLKRS
jgi:DNA helicase-2/ATP-dependent DNA helicase PcrA